MSLPGPIAVDTKKSATELEGLCTALELKQELLTLMRCRRVIGMCSQDQSPRRHAMAIASLAGETQQWDIFMRAHMDILNDRFERMTDGSYAWEQRQTYLKELEELGLQVTDIMLGMSLRAANISTNHYSGTVRLMTLIVGCASCCSIPISIAYPIQTKPMLLLKK